MNDISQDDRNAIEEEVGLNSPRYWRQQRKKMRHDISFNGYELRVYIKESDDSDWDFIPPQGRYSRISSIKPAIISSIIAGKGIRGTARIFGIAKGTVSGIYREMKTNYPHHTILCICGESFGHKGWCWWRFFKSPRRQRFMKEWHNDRAINILGKKIRKEIDQKYSSSAKKVLNEIIEEVTNNKEVTSKAINLRKNKKSIQLPLGEGA